MSEPDRSASLLWDLPWSPSRSRLPLLLTMIGAGTSFGALLGFAADLPPKGGDAFLWQELEAVSRFGLGIGLVSGLALLLSRHVILRAFWATLLAAALFSTGILQSPPDVRHSFDWITEAGSLNERFLSALLQAVPIAVAVTLSAHVTRRFANTLGGVLGSIVLSGLLAIQAPPAIHACAAAFRWRDSWSSLGDYVTVLPPRWMNSLLLGWGFTVSLFFLDWVTILLTERGAIRWILPGTIAGVVAVLVGVMSLGSLMPFTPPSSIEAIAFSPNGRTLVSAHGGQTLRVWKTGEGDPQEIRKVRISRHRDPQPDFAFGGDHLLVADADGCLSWWEIPTLTRLDEAAFPGHGFRSPAVSRDGRCIAVVDEHDNLWFWRRIDPRHPFRRPVEIIPGNQNGLQRIRFSTDSRLMVTLDRTYGASVWQVPEDGRSDITTLDTNTLRREAFGFPLGRSLFEELEASPDSFRFTTFEFDPYDLSPTDSHVVYAHDSRVIVWDWRTDQRVAVVATSFPPIKALAYSPDGRRIAVVDQKNRILVVDTPPGQGD